MSGSTVYAGGDFGSIGGQSRREIARLVDGEHRKVGVHAIELDGRHLASGVFFCRLQAGNTVLSRRLVHFR